MTRTLSLLFLAAVVVSPPSARSDADRERASPEKDIIQQRQEQEIAELIRGLSSEELKQQEAAALRLFTIGEPALEPLREFSKRPDTPEKLRAKELADDIRERGVVDARMSQFFPDGRLVAFVSQQRLSYVHVRDVENGRDLVCLRGTPHQVGSIGVSPDGRYLATPGCRWDGTKRHLNDYWIGIWDWRQGHLVARLHGHQHAIWTASFCPDGEKIVSGSMDGTIRVWSLRTATETASIDAHTGGVCHVQLSPDGNELLSCGWEDNSIKIWDVGTKKELACLKTRTRPIKIAYSTDGKWAACLELGGALQQQPNGQWINPNGAILIIDTQVRKIARRIDYNRACLTSVAIENGGKRLLTGDMQGRLTLWDVEAGLEVGHTAGTNLITGATFMNNGKEGWAIDTLGKLVRCDLPR
jgi:WD40 repeat protein